MTNLYDILGVSKESDSTEIKKSYRKLSLQYHPDRNPDPNATEKYKAINEAYEILSDPQKREQYNTELQFGGRRNGMQQSSGGGDMNDIFSMMFGGGFPGGGFPGGGFPGGGFPGGGGPNIRVFHSNGGGGIEQIFQQMSKPQPIIKEISITLEQAFFGISLTVNIERINNNTGIKEIANLSFDIPPGIDENETIIINNEGNYGQYNTRGDINFNIKIKNNTIFTRNKLDLIYIKHISLKEALCGFEFEITHLNSKLLNLNNLSNISVIKPNFKKILSGLGMNKNDQIGDLIIEFVVDFPNVLTIEQMDILRKLL